MVSTIVWREYLLFSGDRDPVADLNRLTTMALWFILINYAPIMTNMAITS